MRLVRSRSPDIAMRWRTRWRLRRPQGAKRAVMLPVSVPNHSSLMRTPGAPSSPRPSLRSTGSFPAVPIVQNAQAVAPDSLEALLESLSQTCLQPGLLDTYDRATARHPRGDSRLIECGPGKVLAGLVKRIDRQLPVDVVDGPEAVAQRDRSGCVMQRHERYHRARDRCQPRYRQGDCRSAGRGWSHRDRYRPRLRCRCRGDRCTRLAEQGISRGTGMRGRCDRCGRRRAVAQADQPNSTHRSESWSTMPASHATL